MYGVEGSVWLVTITTWHRAPVFQTREFAEIAQEELVRQHNRRGTRLLVYCVMPEHVHAVFQIGKVDLLRIVGSYKSFVSGRCHDAGHGGDVWQERFHDRGIRESEKMDDVIHYVVANPVDDGLVADWREWPWIGGELIETGL